MAIRTINAIIDEILKDGAIVFAWAVFLIFIYGAIIWRVDRPIDTDDTDIIVEKVGDRAYSTTWIYQKDRICANVLMTHTITDADNRRMHVALTGLRAPGEPWPDGRKIMKDIVLQVPEHAKLPVRYDISGTVACNWAQDIMPYRVTFPSVVLD